VAGKIQRTITFSRKRVGKAYVRYVDNMKIFLGQPVKKVKPLFEARIGRDTVKLALENFKASFEDKGDFLILSGEEVDEKVRRLVVFSGVRQTIDDSLGKTLLETVASMGEVEILFWYSRFINAYERGSYWDVHRVAKSLKTLYRIRA
jgi:hypothetical protein